MSTARSLAMNGRTSPTYRAPLPCWPNWSRRTTRSRHGADRGAPASRECAVRRHHRPDHDALVAQGRVAEQHLQAVDQRRVAAEVPPEGRLLRGARGGGQVGRDVAAAEGVDGLLGVADQDQRRRAGERQAEHLPLHRVGVLELVHQHELPAVPHPVAGGARARDRGRRRAGSAGRRSRGCRGRACARSTSRRTPSGEAPPHPGRARPDRRRRAPAGSPGSLIAARPRASASPVVERRGVRRRRSPEAADVQVVDDLHDELVQVLDELGVRLGVAGDAEPGEHLLAELVGGGDGRAVEVGQRGGQPPAPDGHLARRGSRPAAGSARRRRSGRSPGRASARSALTS